MFLANPNDRTRTVHSEETPALLGFVPLIANPDAADRLPEPARAKFLEMRQHAADANAALGPIWKQLDDLRITKLKAEQRLGALIRGDGGIRMMEDNPRIVGERQRIAQMVADVARLQSTYDQRAERWRALADVAGDIESYIKSLRVSITLAPPTPAPKLDKSGDYIGAVTKIRARLTALREDAQAVEDAPRHSDFAKKLAREKIARLAERGRPNTLVSIEAGRDFEFTTTVVTAPAGTGHVGRRIFDAEATFAWLHRDRLIAAVEAEIDATSDDASALSDETRAKKRIQLKAAILATERDEETLICAAADAGQTIYRRRAHDPRAVINLSDDMPEPEQF